MGIRHAKPYTFRGRHSTKLRQSSDSQTHVLHLYWDLPAKIEIVMVKAPGYSMLGMIQGAFVEIFLIAEAKKAIQEMADHSKKWHNGTSTRCISTETSDGLAVIQDQLNNLGREIKKVNEKVYAAQVGCKLCKGPHYTKDCPLKEGKTLEESYYTQFGVPFPQGGQYKAAALGFYQRNNGNPSCCYQKSRSLDQGFRNSNRANEQGSARKGSGNLPRSTEINPRDHVKSILTTVDADTTPIRRIRSVNMPRLYDNCYDEEEGSYELKDLDAYSIGTTLLDDALPTKKKDPGRLGKLAPTKLIIELADRTVKRPKGIVENVLVRIDKFVFPVDFIVLDMPEDIKTHLILGRPFLSTAHTKIYVFKRKITLRVGNDKVVFKSDKPTSNIIKRVYVLSLREMMELNLEAMLMGEALILNISLNPLYGDYIELNDINEPLELRRNQVDNLEPTIEEGEVVDEPMMDIVKTRCDNEIIDGLDEYPSYCDFDRKIHIDCAYNQQFSCMIGYKYVNVNFLPLLSINVMSKRFYNSMMKDKVEYKGKNVVGASMNVPIFVGKFSIVTDLQL
ncbi:ribonuclease H-like domain, reverse transcriptase, RNA-dependent DNA polymerase [Tanacetum coccineum]